MKKVEKVTIESVSANIRGLKRELAINPCPEIWEKLMYEYDLYDMLVTLRLKDEEKKVA